jgi:hypothetical protein
MRMVYSYSNGYFPHMRTGHGATQATIVDAGDDVDDVDDVDDGND